MPRSRGEFLFGNDRVYSWESGDLPTGSQWGIRAVNSDIYDHMLEVVFYVDELTSRPAGATITLTGYADLHSFLAIREGATDANLAVTYYG